MSLPLHAAGIYGARNTECCSDYVVSSYTPTLTTLLRAQESNPSIRKNQVKLGLISVMQAWDVNLPTLSHVEDEISHVQAAAKIANISLDDSKSSVGDATTVAHVSEVLKSTNLVHIACHGTQSVIDPLSSGFCLSDSTLSVSRLMGLNLQDTFFAFLSACETAKGDKKQPDQTIHLAAATLFVGFRSLVATMWCVPITLKSRQINPF
jgi:CHAT domain-containing protein